MTLTPDQKRWARRGRQGLSAQQCRNLIVSQSGKCALSGVGMRFDSDSGTSVSRGAGCHPLYAALDHVSPGRSDHGHQIICYDLNDLKACLPPVLFDALRRTPEWKVFMQAWRDQAEKDQNNRQAFKALIKRGTT